MPILKKKCVKCCQMRYLNIYLRFRTHINPPPEVVVTDTAATITTERYESSSSSQQMTTTIETTVTKSSGCSSTITEVSIYDSFGLRVVKYY